MKRQVRQGVFETNSSSTHSLTICTEDEYNKWKNGELLFDYWDDEFINPNNSFLTDDERESVKENYNNKKGKYWKDWEDLSDEEKEELYAEKLERKHSDAMTYDEWINRDYLETYVHSYTTPNGEKIIAFGRYGYDG